MTKESARKKRKMVSQIKEMAAAQKRRKMRQTEQESVSSVRSTGVAAAAGAAAMNINIVDANQVHNVEERTSTSTSLDTAATSTDDSVVAPEASVGRVVNVAVAKEVRLEELAKASTTATTSILAAIHSGAPAAAPAPAESTPTATEIDDTINIAATNTNKNTNTTWACSSCTYHNAISCRRCTICKARRPTPEEETESATTTTTETETGIVQGSGGKEKERVTAMKREGIPITSSQSTAATSVATATAVTPKNSSSSNNKSKRKGSTHSKQAPSNSKQETRSSSRSSSRSRSRRHSNPADTDTAVEHIPVEQALRKAQEEEKEDGSNNISNNNTDRQSKSSGNRKRSKSKSKVANGALAQSAEPLKVAVLPATDTDTDTATASISISNRTHKTTEPIVDPNCSNVNTNAVATAAVANTDSDDVQQQRLTLLHENDALRQMLKNSSAQNSQALLLLDQQQQMLVDFQRQTANMLRHRQQLQRCLEQQQDRLQHFMLTAPTAPLQAPNTNMNMIAVTVALMDQQQQEPDDTGTGNVRSLSSGSNSVRDVNLDHPPLSARKRTPVVYESTALTYTSSPEESFKSPAITISAAGTAADPSSRSTPLQYVSSKSTSTTATATSSNSNWNNRQQNGAKDRYEDKPRPRQLAPPLSPANSTQTIDPDHASQLQEQPYVTPMHATAAAAVAIERTVSTDQHRLLQTRSTFEPTPARSSSFTPRQEQKYCSVQAAATSQTPPSAAKSAHTVDPDQISQHQEQWWQHQRQQTSTIAPRQVVPQPPTAMPLKKFPVAPQDLPPPAASVYRSRSDNQARRVTLEKADPSSSPKTTSSDSRLLGRPTKWQAPASSSSSGHGATAKSPLLNSTNSNRSTNASAKTSGAPLVAAVSAVASTSIWTSNAPARDFMQSMDQATGTMSAPPKEGIGSTTWTKSRRQSRSHPIAAAAATTTNRGDALWDEESNSQPNYAYKETVRCKTERQGLPCHDCSDCRKFYEALRKGGHEFSQPMGADCDGSSNNDPYLQHSRHRARFTPPETPADFWELDFIDEKLQAEKEGRSLDKHV